MRERILTLAARPGGMQTAELGRENIKRVSSLCDKLLKLGLLHRAKLSHKHVRWFTDARLAAEFERASRRDNPAPVALKRSSFAPDAVVIVPPDVKITIAPTPRAALRTNTYAPF